jgi:hypothetical protein
MDLTTLKEFDELLDPSQARILIGNAGVGKSSVVKELAESRGCRVIDLRLSELEPGDLVGMPFVKKDEQGIETTYYAKPHWWPTDGNVYLFLDEVDRCREDMIPLAMQLTLDRRAGNRTLPPGVRIYAAGNGGKFATIALDQAFCNRVAYIQFTPTREEWLKWAKNSEVHRAVVDFISAHKDMLDTPEKDIGKADLPVPSRRSWHAVSRMLTRMPDDITRQDKMYQFCQPFLGDSAAMQFALWVKDKYVVLAAADIFSGEAKPQNVNTVQLTTIMAEIVDGLLGNKYTDEEKHNCLAFFMKAGGEPFGTLFSALPSSGISQINKFPDVRKWIEERMNEIQKRSKPHKIK